MIAASIKSWLRSALVASGLAIGCGAAVAQQPCATELEPNDQPETAQPFAGPFCLEGSISNSDQEILAWTVDVASSAMPWTMRLLGPMGIETRLQIHELEEPGSSDSPAVVGPELMAIVKAPGTDRAERSNIYLKPGSWLIGLSASPGEGGSYRVDMIPGSTPASPASSNATAQTAKKVPSAFQLQEALVGKEAWYAWQLPGLEARRRWTLATTAPLGSDVGFALLTMDGRPLLESSRIADGRLELADIGLPEGTYLVRLNRGGEVPYPFSLEATSQGPRSPGREEEPNDTTLTARPLMLGQSMAGRISQPGDVDRYVLPANASGQLLTIQLGGTSGASKRLCVGSAAGDTLQCSEGEAPSLSDVAATDATRFITVSGGADPRAGYELTARISGPVSPDREAEPNDTTVSANPLTGVTVSGRMPGDDVDMFRFEVSDGDLRSFTATGDGVLSMEIVDGQNQSSARVDRQVDAEQKNVPGPLELKDVALQHGTYFLTVAGKGGDYSVTSSKAPAPAVAADINPEREPNDDAERAQLLAMGDDVTASLKPGGDTDIYRMTVREEDGLDLYAISGSECSLELQLSWDSWSGVLPLTVGRSIHYASRLRPGDYMVRIRAGDGCSAADVPYKVGYALLPDMPMTGDVEPNDAFNLARDMPADLKVTGVVGNYTDDDWHRLPPVAADTEVTVKVTGDVDVLLTDGKAASSFQMAQPTEIANNFSGSTVTGVVPGGRSPTIRVSRKGGEGAFEYTLEATIAGIAAAKPEAVPPAATPASSRAVLGFDDKAVAAYWHRGQRIAGKLTISNTSQAVRHVTLRSGSVPPGWTLEMPATVDAVPGDTAVPVALAIEADAHAARAARIAVDVVEDGAAPLPVVAEVAVLVDAQPVGDHLSFNLPNELLGGFNVAWTSLGGQLDPDPKVGAEETPETLNDGLGSNAGLLADAAKLPLDFTVRFGAGRAWPIRGITINPQTPGIWPAEYIRDFELLLSRDGRTFETALKGRVSPEPREQSFLLPQAVEAAAAQLRILSNHDGNLGRVGVSEWKVIADPAAGIGVPLDIADSLRGGHIVWSAPQISDQTPLIRGVLEAGGPGTVAKLAPGMTPEFTLGFNENRAARITSIEWIDSTLENGARYFGDVTIDVSTETPFGPWTRLGGIRSGGEAPVTFKPDQPVWARFLRFTAAEASQEDGARLQFPTSLRVMEQATDATYRSILGEWGQYSPLGFYETKLPVAAPARMESDANDSRETAERLAMTETVSGRVEIGKDEDWYRIEVPADRDLLTVTLAGEPTVGVDVELKDETGKPIGLSEIEGTPRRTVFEGRVQAGKTHYLRIVQPPHSVVIAYDTSGSLLGFIPIIFNALEVFANGVTPGHEAVNFLPFDRSPMLKDFSDQPRILLDALAKDQRESTTSGLESTMITAMQLLSPRRGTRAILVVTDAASSTVSAQSDMWTMMSEVRPRLFAAHAGSFDDPLREKQVLEDMAMASGGHYVSSRSQAELDVAFDRVAAWLRRPAGYSLSVDARRAAPPEPGALLVSGSPTEVVNTEVYTEPEPAGAVEIVLDASGSMLKRLDGKRRIEIARESLSKLVGQTLKPEDPVALRVFGHDRPGSCETTLLQPVGPLDPASAVSMISSIEPQNLAKTPIAASLRGVAEDLAGVEGRKTVILLTDGEETCGGDPRAEIQTLAQKDIEVRVNIIGFAVDDPELKGEFAEWARIGRGRYFDAADAAGLDKAVKAATELPYRVLDTAGAVVGLGSVGGPAIDLPAGHYRVEIASVPPRTFEGVAVREKETTRLQANGI